MSNDVDDTGFEKYEKDVLKFAIKVFDDLEKLKNLKERCRIEKDQEKKTELERKLNDKKPIYSGLKFENEFNYKE